MNHQVYTLKMNKTCLSPWNDKFEVVDNINRVSSVIKEIKYIFNIMCDEQNTSNRMYFDRSGFGSENDLPRC